WNRAQTLGELPAPAGTFCLRSGTACDIWGSQVTHGEGVAEIVHEMAPGASLYLATVRTASDLQAAVDWFAANGVKVISRSLGADFDGPGDGTGPIDAVVDDAVAKGMTWFNSAGNTGADGYWRGQWRDTDGDGWLDFAPGDETMGFTCESIAGLRW